MSADTMNRGKLPNIIVIFTDDQGYQDLGCFGAPDIKTPRIDQMAREGMVFTDFYVASPVCTPSRAALMTGCYPQRVGMGGEYLGPDGGPGIVLFPQSPSGLSTDEITIARLLKTQGYATACIGKWHLGRPEPFLPRRHGFDYYYGIPYSNDMRPCCLMRNEDVIEDPAVQETLTERYTDEAVRFIEANKDQPFFLYLPQNMPHTPLHASERFSGKSIAGLYGDVIECLDWSTGVILDRLKELDIDDNTLVVFTSDNGPWLVMGNHGGRAHPLRAGKGTTYDGGQRVPCVMRWPGKIPAGGVCAEMASTIDFLPTFAKLAGAQAPTDRIIDGKDIWPLMSGQPGAKTPHEAFYFYFMDNLQAVRSGKWKLVFARSKHFEHVFHQHFYQVAEDMEIVPEALYDLETDIGEQFNLIDQYPEEAARLRALADQMREDLGDYPEALPGHTRPPCQFPGKNRRPIGRVQEG